MLIKQVNKSNPQLKLLIWILLFLILTTACRMEPDKEKNENLKNEIIKTELDFAEMVKHEGIAKAFLYYAAEDAVLNRNNNLIKGKEEIQNYFESQTLQNVKLEWVPDFVDVAKSGDLAYTYGKYTFSATNSNGKKINSEGIFHTIWKKQSDSTWKYVWD